MHRIFAGIQSDTLFFRYSVRGGQSHDPIEEVATLSDAQLDRTPYWPLKRGWMGSCYQIMEVRNFFRLTGSVLIHIPSGRNLE